MLVLTRKANESIQLGDNIHITVVSIDGDRVRIGIDAPRELKIYRKELLQEVTDINKEAASASLGALNLEFERKSQKNMLENEK
jgi:carbon storage regulator